MTLAASMAQAYPDAAHIVLVALLLWPVLGAIFFIAFEAIIWHHGDLE